MGIGALAAGCVRNIDQDVNSGKDAKYKGAKKIELDEGGEAKAKGIVTYPGGDRVDWKFFEVPAEKTGTVELKLRHTPPRPGLDVAFNVFDEFGKRIGRVKPAGSRPKRTKRDKIKDLTPGKYYVQIYAPSRMDAGTYKLTLRFKEAKKIDPVDLEKLASQIPDPPTLPAPVEPVVLSPEEIAAKAEADRVAKEAADAAAAAAAAAAASAPQPVTARIVGFQAAAGGEVIITLNRGKNNGGVDRGWSGQVLKGGPGGGPLQGGDFKVMKVTADKSIGKVKLTLDVIQANKTVLLSP
jgi:hypothetical protein